MIIYLRFNYIIKYTSYSYCKCYTLRVARSARHMITACWGTVRCTDRVVSYYVYVTIISLRCRVPCWSCRVVRWPAPCRVDRPEHSQTFHRNYDYDSNLTFEMPKSWGTRSNQTRFPFTWTRKKLVGSPLLLYLQHFSKIPLSQKIFYNIFFYTLWGTMFYILIWNIPLIIINIHH